MFKKIVKFVVVGGDAQSEFNFMPDNFFLKNKNRNKLVLVGTVNNGSITTGASVVLKSLIKGKDNVIESKISRMEVEKEEVTEASAGMAIGILLQGVSIKELRNIRRTHRMKLFSN